MGAKYILTLNLVTLAISFVVLAIVFLTHRSIKRQRQRFERQKDSTFSALKSLQDTIDCWDHIVEPIEDIDIEKIDLPRVEITKDKFQEILDAEGYNMSADEVFEQRHNYKNSKGDKE